MGEGRRWDDAHGTADAYLVLCTLRVLVLHNPLHDLVQPDLVRAVLPDLVRVVLPDLAHTVLVVLGMLNHECALDRCAPAATPSAAHPATTTPVGGGARARSRVEHTVPAATSVYVSGTIKDLDPA